MRRASLAWLSIARALWLGLVLPISGLLLWLAVREYIATPLQHSFGWTPATYAVALAQLGVPAAALNLIYAVSTNLTRLAFVVVSVVLFWRSTEGMVALTALTLLTFAVTAGGAPNLPPDQPALGLFVSGMQFLGQALFFTFIFIFPSGRFAPRWLAWPTLVAIVATNVLGRVPGALETWVGSALSWLSISWLLLTALPAQVFRYRRISSPLERQQTKLVVFAMALFLVGGAGSWLLSSYLLPALNALPAPGTGARLLFDFAMAELQVLPTVALPVTIGIAVLRYRLWDIDVIIRRTLVYSVLTALLALTYFGSVLVLQSLFEAITGEGQNVLVTVISTLTIAALFGPLRGRVQRAIDRRFFRQKYDAARTLAAFGAQARDVVALEQLSEQLVAAVDDTMQPERVGLWLRKAGGR